MDELGLNYIYENYQTEIYQNDLIEYYKNSLENEISNNQKSFDSVKCRDTKKEEVEQYHHLLLEIYALQRKELFKMRKHKEFEDSEIRKAELQIDLNDLKVTGNEH